MSNFTSSNPIDDIGTLELNHASVLFSDDRLEASVVSMTGPTSANNCGTVWPCARRNDDGALEASATMGPGQTIITYCGCGHVDDGALEAAAVATSGPTIQYCNTLVGANCPRRIDDGALENAAVTVAAGPTIAPCTVMTCPRIDDGELEATAGILHANPTGAGNICNMTGPLMCPRRIDDGIH